MSFEAWRGPTLPATVDASGWSHAYRLAVNTRLEASEPAKFAVGGPVKERALLG